MISQLSYVVAPTLPRTIRSAAISISRRTSINPTLRHYINQQLVAVNRRRDRQRTAQTKAEIATATLSDIRFNALARYTKRGLIAYLETFASNEFIIDRLGELAIDLNRDIEAARNLRDGRSIRRMLRNQL